MSVQVNVLHSNYAWLWHYASSQNCDKVFLVQHLATTSNLQQLFSNTHFSLATGVYKGVRNWSLGLWLRPNIKTLLWLMWHQRPVKYIIYRLLTLQKKISLRSGYFVTTKQYCQIMTSIACYVCKETFMVITWSSSVVFVTTCFLTHAEMRSSHGYVAITTRARGILAG